MSWFNHQLVRFIMVYIAVGHENPPAAMNKEESTCREAQVIGVTRVSTATVRLSSNHEVE